MSFETIKREIHRFLESEKPEVLAIKGAWGVGKTFTWNQILLDAKNSNRIKLKKYSYVSLFGINSLDAFKFAIFEQQIGGELIGTEPSLETFKSNTASVVASLGKKYFHIFQGIPFVKNVTPALESVSFLSLSKTLICVDDFERKGSDLSPRDILGLLSTLKEQKKCKIILILNDSSFEDESLTEYEKYKEKVVDVELMFDPSSEECAEISLDPNNLFSQKIKEFLIRLDINNIRIIKKIERLAMLLNSALSNYLPEVLQQALHSLVLFSLSYYVKGEKVPSPDYIKNIGHKMFGLDDDELNNQEKLWNSVLAGYDFQTTDEFDLEIAKAVEFGYIDEDALIQEAEKLNEKYIAAKSDSSFEQAWHKYHDSFDDDGDQVLQDIYESFKINTKYISPNNLNGTVKLFRDLGREEWAEEVIDFYIETRKDEKDLFDLELYAFGGDIDDKSIIEKFYKFKGETKERKAIRDVLEAIAGKTGWGGNDAEVLANATVDEYYELFKNEKGRDLARWVNTCLKFGRFTNSSDRDKQIAGKATEALIRIAGENEMNARRVAKYGIKLEKEDENNENNA